MIFVAAPVVRAETYVGPAATQPEPPSVEQSSRVPITLERVSEERIFAAFPAEGSIDCRKKGDSLGALDVLCIALALDFARIGIMPSL